VQRSSSGRGPTRSAARHPLPLLVGNAPRALDDDRGRPSRPVDPRLRGRKARDDHSRQAAAPKRDPQRQAGVGRAGEADEGQRGAGPSRRLEAQGIESRRTVGSVANRAGKPVAAAVVLVPRVDIDDARFVLVRISYERPTTAQLAWRSVRRRFVAALVGGVCYLALLLQSAPMSLPSEGCTGGSATHNVCPGRHSP
jgi:hypothetical protein